MERPFKDLRPGQRGNRCFESLMVDIALQQREKERRKNPSKLQNGMRMQFYEIYDKKGRNAAVLFLKMKGYTWEDGQKWLKEREEKNQEKKTMEKLDKIKEKALENNIPIIMDDTLDVIAKILKEIKPKRMLEIGTAVGYSAICFSKFLADDGKIDTIERDEERVKEAKINIKDMNLENKINLLEGDAVEILPTLNEEYNVVFIDAAKGKYPFFLKESIRMLSNSRNYFCR